MPKPIYCLAASAFVALLLGACAGPDTRFQTKGGPLKNAMGPADSSVETQDAARFIIATMTDAVHQQLTGGTPLTMQQPGAETELPPAYGAFLDDMAKHYGLSRVADWPLQSLGVRCLVFETARADERDAVMAKLARDPRIESVQAMQMFSTASTAYDDPYLDLQRNLATMDVADTHRWATGKGVRVAVIDTGIDIEHEDLREHIEAHRNFVDADAAAFKNDRHGTAVAGVIAATTNNGKGIAGIAPDASILAYKGCWQSKEGNDKAVCSSFTLAKAINVAVGAQPDIINLSLAGPGDPLLERLVRQGLEKQITFVAAVSPNPGQPFPGDIPGVIAVDTAERYGPASDAATGTVHAPGENIVSLSPGDEYAFFSGSSLSTAQVSGVIALIKERKPHLDNDKVRALLRAPVARYRQADGKPPMVDACGSVAKIVGARCEQ